MSSNILHESGLTPNQTDNGDKNPFLAALGERVRALRARRGMTRKAVAQAAEVSERHLANLEYGEGNVSILLLLQVAHALQSSLAELLGEPPRHQLLIGVQPVDLDDFGGSLRPEVKAMIDPAIAAARTYLDRFAVAWLPADGTNTTRLDMPHEALDIAVYEAGRPSPEVACRIGDWRVLASRVNG